jgi:hypothetical protein
LILAIIGLQLFGDDTYNACRMTAKAGLLKGEPIWPLAPIDYIPCTRTTGLMKYGGFQCPSNYTCGSPLDFGLNTTIDNVESNKVLFYDIATFKNIVSSLITVFQLVNADNSMAQYANLVYSSDFLLPTLFLILIHMFGTFYIMNLPMVFIMESYIEAEDQFAKDEIETRKNEIKQLESTLDLVSYKKGQKDIEKILKRTESTLASIAWKEEHGHEYHKGLDKQALDEATKSIFNPD